MRIRSVRKIRGDRWWATRVLTPSMLTDVKTVFDVLDLVGRRMVQDEQLIRSGQTIALTETLTVTRGEVTRAEFAALGVHERNSLNAHLGAGAGYQTFQLICPEGYIEAFVEQRPGAEDSVAAIEQIALETLLPGSTWRPTWRRGLPLLPLVPILPMVAGIIALAAGVTVPVGAWLLIGALSASVSALLIQWSRRLRRSGVTPKAKGRITFRGQSRAQTYADRANRHASIRVAILTSPIAIGVATIVAWLSGWLDLE